MKMKLTSAGIPNIEMVIIVTKLIGIDRFNGPNNKLYPYNKKELKIIFFIKTKIFLII